MGNKEMTVQPTSLEAYTTQLYKLDNHQQLILNILQKHPNMSDNDLLRYLRLTDPHNHWEINKITPRRNELYNMELILDNGEKIDRLTGRRVIKWIPK